MYAEVVPVTRLEPVVFAFDASDSRGNRSLPDSDQLPSGLIGDGEENEWSWVYSCWVQEHCEDIQDATCAPPPRLFDALHSPEGSSDLRRTIIPSQSQSTNAIDLPDDSTSGLEPPSPHIAGANETSPFGSAHSSLFGISSSVPLDLFFDASVISDTSSASLGPAWHLPLDSLPEASSEVSFGDASDPGQRAGASRTPAGNARRSESKSPLFPSPSSLQAAKSFPCPKLNCRKSYKQSKGLRYHMAHGTCSSQVPQDREPLWKALFAANRRVSSERAARVSKGDAGGARPYACTVGDCTSRYKKIAGLRYHYFHSGLHGIDGLSRLASGSHACLTLLSGRGRRAAMEHASRALEPLRLDHGSQQ